MRASKASRFFRGLVACVCIAGIFSPSSSLADDLSKASATAIAELLKQGGIPLTYPITDTTKSPFFKDERRKAGIISSAVTATDDADISITVFESSQLRNDARLRQIKACPGCAYITECGSILLSFVGTRSRAPATREQSRLAYKLLRNKHKCE